MIREKLQLDVTDLSRVHVNCMAYRARIYLSISEKKVSLMKRWLEYGPY